MFYKNHVYDCGDISVAVPLLLDPKNRLLQSNADLHLHCEVIVLSGKTSLSSPPVSRTVDTLYYTWNINIERNIVNIRSPTFPENGRQSFQLELLRQSVNFKIYLHMVKGVDGQELEQRISLLDVNGNKRFIQGICFVIWIF